MGGGGGPTNSTVTQSNVPDWLRPQVENVLMGAGKNLFQTKKVDSGEKDEAGNIIYNEEITGTKPFTPYSSDPSKYVAGFSPLQQQVQYNAANLQMPGQFNQATGYANAAAQGGLGTAAQAAGYGNAGFQSGQQGQQLGIQGGQYYGNMGAQSGQMGQQLGTKGGAKYGAMGAAFGQQAANLAPQAQGYGGMGAGYGAQAAQLADTALGYGQRASTIGDMALQAQQTGQGITAQSQDLARQQAAAGQNYARQMTDPSAIQQYMNPYTAAVIDPQIQAAQRQADIASTVRGAQAARSGAFGGSRQAIENAEANRALAGQMGSIRAQGQQAAYDKAVQNMQYGSNLGLTGLSGAQSGLGTALQGGQLGLSGIGQALAGQQGALSGVGQAGSMYGLGMQGAGMGLQGINAANQAYQTGIQGAGMGLQGVNTQLAGTAQGMQGAQVGLQGVDRQLAGTAQGMQGAQVGLQGVTGQQAGYGLANQAAGTLGSLGTQQLNAQQGILGLQNQIGGQQQGQQQQIINQAIQNFANAQNAPMDAFNQYNALLRGYAVPGTTTTQYQAQPTLGNQLAGYGTAGVSALALNNALNPASGSDIRVKENIERIGTLANGLGLYEFEYKPEFKDHPQCGHGRFRGVMAQEVEKLIPEAVVTMDNGYKAVKYNLVEMELS
jgi:hypothetical protein